MDLGFAIDDLYSAGWWPGDGDGCLKSSDGRWYPDSVSIDRAVERAGLTLAVSERVGGLVARASLSGSDGQRFTVVAGNREAASVLAFAELARTSGVDLDGVLA